MKNLYMLTMQAVMLLILFPIVHAGVCSLGVSEKPYFGLGDQTTVTFINLYTPATTGNVTLDLSSAPGLTIVSGDNPQDNIAFATTATWVVNFTSLGEQTLTANMIDSNGGVFLCTASNIINVTAEPNLTATLSTLTDVYALQLTNFISVINNIGLGDATDVQVSVSHAGGSSVTNSSYTFPSLAAQSSTPLQHSFTPQVCGLSDSMTVNVQYRDSQGNLMSHIASDTVFFNVTGADLGVSASANPSVALPGSNIELRASVNNPGSLTAQNVFVDFIVNGTSVHTSALANIPAGSNLVHSYNWSSLTEAVYGLVIVVSSDHDCNIADNSATTSFSVSGTVPPVCGNGICESGEDSSNCPADCGAIPPAPSGGGGGGGGGGGSGSRIFYLVLTEEKPEATLPLRNGDTVKYDWNGMSYSFIVRNIFADMFKMGVSESMSYVTYDFRNLNDYEINLDSESGADLGIRPSNKGPGSSDVTFYLLGLTGKRIVDILPPGSVDRKIVDVGSFDPESAGILNPSEPLPDYAEGVLEFNEELDKRTTVPFWAGLLLAALIAVAGTGLYVGVTRK